MERRTQDSIYLSEKRKHTPKEYFKFIAKENNYSNIEKGNVLDIGCATGDFIYYLNSINPNLNYTGLDIMQSLLDIAKDECPFSRFLQGNIYTGENLPAEKYDFISVCGVHSIFDDLEPLFKNIFSLANNSCAINFFGAFNPEELDVIIKSKRYDETFWEKGWNMFSINSVTRLLKDNYENISFEFIPWHVNFNIPRDNANPYRSYTIDMPGDDKLVINGLQLIHRFYLLKIRFQ